MTTESRLATARARRASRNRARRIALKLGLLSRTDSHLDIDHIDGDPLNNAPANLRAVPRAANRARHRAWMLL